MPIAKLWIIFYSTSIANGSCSALNTTIQDPSDFKNTIQRQKNISKK